MRRANVYCRGVPAGVLSQDADRYTFEYLSDYLRDISLPAISLSFPKHRESYASKELFPFFFGLLAEGEDKVLQCRLLRIDEKDHFTRLLKTCAAETIGGVTIEESA